MGNKTIVINGTYLLTDSILSVTFSGCFEVKVVLPAGKFIIATLTSEEKERIMKTVSSSNFVLLAPHYINVSKISGFYKEVTKNGPTLYMDFTDGSSRQYQYQEKSLKSFVTRIEEKLYSREEKPAITSSAQ